MSGYEGSEAQQFARERRDAALAENAAGHPAFRCQVCHEQGSWRLLRRGDAAVSWACSPHLADVLIDLQRPPETTEVVVTFRWVTT